MGRKKDFAWEYCVKVLDSADKKKGRLLLKCKYCGKEMWGGVIRLKHHLACDHVDVEPCLGVPDDVKKICLSYLNELKRKNMQEEEQVECFVEAQPNEKVQTSESMASNAKGGTLDAFYGEGRAKGTKLKQTTINQHVKDRYTVCRDIGRCFYGNNIAFNVVKSPLFLKMVESIANYGKGFKPPSYHEIRVSLLRDEVQDVTKLQEEKYKSEWKRTGCTLMSDGWTDGKSRSITNFLINSPSGTFFLKSVDTSDIVKNGENLYNLLDAVVEEVREENVVQVVTDSASSYVLAGTMLEEKRKKLFWSPCSAHCINLMLKDIGELPVHNETIEKARKVTIFIYRHCWVLNLMRDHTNGKELARPGVTRFATNYLTLKSLWEQKEGLQAMFTSQQWVRSSYAKMHVAKEVHDIVLCDLSFWKSIKYCLKCAIPLVNVLKLVDGDAKPAMGYIYEAMDRAKEIIAKNFSHVKHRYANVWSIIDERWDMQLHRPLHAAGYYLNPKFHFSPNFIADAEVKKGLYATIERMCPEPDERIKIILQIERFTRGEGMFSGSTAILARDKTQPAIWWEMFGEECKELQKVAIRILSLTCSATGCERNWSVFEHVHSKKRNKLAQLRLNYLVFVKYNLQLESRQSKRIASGDSYEPICLSDMDSDDEWITEKEAPCLPEDNSWMDVHECFGEGEPSKTMDARKKRKKRGPRNLNKVAKKKGKSIVVEEEEEEFVESDEEDEGSEELTLDDDDSDSSFGSM